MNHLTVAVAQNLPLNQSTSELGWIKEYAYEAATKGVEVLVLPELASVGYHLERLKNLKEYNSKKFLHNLSTVCMEQNVSISAGFYLAEGNSVFNSTVLSLADGSQKIYKKIHLFDMSSERESDLFQSGEEASMISWKSWKFGQMICFDLRFPELARALSLAGVDILCVNSAWPLGRREVFRTLCQARAIENQVYLLSSNCVGLNAGNQAFAGTSMVIAPDGDILAELDEKTPGMAVVKIDKNRISAVRNRLDCYSKRNERAYTVKA
jgi:omega-amidase